MGWRWLAVPLLFLLPLVAAGERTVVYIGPDDGGAYRVDGRLNGEPVRFVVDTGASMVAISERLAVRAGIQYRQGMRVRVPTGGGAITGYRTRVERLSVGGLERQDVALVVMEGRLPGEPVLGMSFLGRVRMRSVGSTLLLQAPN